MAGSRRKNQYTRPNNKDRDVPKVRRRPCKVSTSSGANVPLLLACTHSKKDPNSYRKCAGRAFSKISYMKMHLYRCHVRREHSCSRCGTLFEDQQRRDDHMAANQCPGQPEAASNGTYDEIREKLHKPSNSLLTIAEQWFVVFDIVFPGHPHPLSPFHDSEVSDVASSGFLEFSTRDAGIDIVLES